MRGGQDGIRILFDERHEEIFKDVSVAVSGSVTGATGKGIHAKGSISNVSLTVSGSVSGATHGLYTRTEYGNVDLSVSGPITVTGGNSIGIDAETGND